MKKILLSVFLIALFTVGIAEAKILRVDNNTGTSAPYSTLAAAYAAAVSGDTLQFAGSQSAYNGENSNSPFMIEKKLTFIGPGYFLSNNSNLQANPYPAMLNAVRFKSGAAGSEIKSMYFKLDLEIWSCNYLIFTNNYVYYLYNSGNGSNIVFVGNFIMCNFMGYYNNLVFNNNYCIGYVNTGNAVLTNNIIAGNISASNASFTNNIIVSGTLSGSTNTFYNNLANGTQVPEDNGNQRNVNMEDVFVCWSDCTGFSTDGKYVLSEDSQAKGAGLDGVDCGIFGGDMPYVLSGLPNIPSIYLLQVPGTASQNNLMKVTIKAKSN
jgi:hypothetical protein